MQILKRIFGIENIIEKIPLFLVVSFLVTACLYLVVEKIIHRENKLYKYCILFCCIIYLSFLYEVFVGIFGGLGVEVKRFEPNIIPIIEIIEAYTMKNEWMLMQFLLNIIVMIPCGLFLPILFERFNKVHKTAVIILFLAIIIEILQYFMGERADIDDIFARLLGGSVGYILFLIGKKMVLLYRNFREKQENF